MKLEIGGGYRPRGDGFVNLDRIPEADIIHDLEVRPWPVEDNTVVEVYTSHCIEHVVDPVAFLNECCRVCVIGAKMEIRCPAPFAELMFVMDHKHCFSPQNARNMDIHFPKDFWRHIKRPKLINYKFQSSEKLERAKKELPFLRGLNDQVIMEWIPGTAHEVCFFYEVQLNEFYQGEPSC